MLIVNMIKFNKLVKPWYNVAFGREKKKKIKLIISITDYNKIANAILQVSIEIKEKRLLQKQMLLSIEMGKKYLNSKIF